jgi:hypothetical protein
MEKQSSKRETVPDSKRRKNLSPKSGSTFFSPESGMSAKRQTFFIKTFGWPMVQVPRDDFRHFKDDN